MHALRQHREPAVFLDAARPLWQPREAELNLLVGVACSVRDGRWRPEAPALFATLDEGDRPIAAVMRTPPAGLVIAADDAEAAAELAARLAATGEHRDAPSIVASAPCAGAFAAVWSRATGRTASLGMAQRIYELTQVTYPRPAPGRFRRATRDDADQLAGWLAAGELEASPDPPAPRDALMSGTRRRIEDGYLFVWETEAGLASVAALARPTPNGFAVNAVYTPPEQRGRGYASSCVAAVSQHALDAGKRFTCLYTDASNPTSNAIYQRIGYRFVCESEHWSLAPAR